MRIEHRIPADSLVKMNNSQINVIVSVIEAMKAKKVPIVGSISILSVEHGVFTTYKDGDEWVYAWEGEIKTKPRPKPVITDEEL